MIGSRVVDMVGFGSGSVGFDGGSIDDGCGHGRPGLGWV